MGFLEQVEHTRFSQWVSHSGSIWAFPTILLLHTYGMAILAEGLIELIGENGLKAVLGNQLRRYATVEEDDQGNFWLPRDEFGHLRLGEIEFGRIMRDTLKRRMIQHGLKGLTPTFVDKDLGYELRCADPIPFDAEYTRNLGYAAVKFLNSDNADKCGAIISFIGGNGGNMHSLEEWFEPAGSYKGIQKALLTILLFDAQPAPGR